MFGVFRIFTKTNEMGIFLLFILSTILCAAIWVLHLHQHQLVIQAYLYANKLKALFEELYHYN